ncbi:MAG: hypothetical protein COA75_14070 [Cellvibrionales bacterium]|nr:MAG: hypothetical protein COA75_14070 [Cellvibrionales bacterium]
MKMNIRQYQRGAATLVATVVLVLLASLTVLVVNKSSIGEQQRSGIDARSKEVYAAGNAALRYGFYQLMIQYNDNNLATPFGSADGTAIAGATALIDYDPDDDAVTDADGDSDDRFVQGIDSFMLDSRITYTLITDEDEHPAIIEVTAPVVGATESHVQKTISMRVLREDLGSGSTFAAPPLVVEGCIPPGSALGNPKVISDEIAVATIQGDSDDPDCLDPGHIDIVGGGDVGEPTNGNPDTTLMEAMFGSNDAGDDIKIASDLQAAWPIEDRTVFYVTATSPWHDDVGSLASPVILFFAEESLCPSMNGGPVIYGLVYFEAPADGCDNPGSGAATIFGTVAYEGNLNKINANIVMVQVDFGDGGANAGFAKVIVPLPSSWRDFAP